jgi:hypothetical protein
MPVEGIVFVVMEMRLGVGEREDQQTMGMQPLGRKLSAVRACEFQMLEKAWQLGLPAFPSQSQYKKTEVIGSF